MRRFQLVNMLSTILGASLFGYCGNHIATRMGLTGWEAAYLIGYSLAPILLLCPAFYGLGLRLKGLEDKVRGLEEKAPGRDVLTPTTL